MANLVDRLLPDELWQRVQPLLSAPPPRRRGGVPRRVSDRNCVAVLVFMARTRPSVRHGMAGVLPLTGLRLLAWRLDLAPRCAASLELGSD
jgi:hypothetical protein